jgi:hypothetical protein
MFSSEKLMITLINDIFNSKYYKYTFYIHNLARFDSVFIIDLLTKNEEFKINTITREDGKFVYLKISKNFDNKKRSIIILDSYLMLKGKLRDLVKDFGCLNRKGLFPHKFVT